MWLSRQPGVPDELRQPRSPPREPSAHFLPFGQSVSTVKLFQGLKNAYPYPYPYILHIGEFWAMGLWRCPEVN